MRAYDKIINPNTGRLVYIKSKLGKTIIQNYSNNILRGGAISQKKMGKSHKPSTNEKIVGLKKKLTQVHKDLGSIKGKLDTICSDSEDTSCSEILWKINNVCSQMDTIKSYVLEIEPKATTEDEEELEPVGRKTPRQAQKEFDEYYKRTVYGSKKADSVQSTASGYSSLDPVFEYSNRIRALNKLPRADKKKAFLEIRKNMSTNY